MNRLTLYNMAIALVGGARIHSTDIGASADICNDFIEVVTGSTLTAHDFTFARKSEILTQRATTDVGVSSVGIGAYTYSFTLPGDMVQLISIDDLEIGDWKIYGRVLGTEVESVVINYTAEVNSIPLYPSILAEALSYYLAYYIAPGISGFDESRRDLLYQQYVFFLKKAIEADAALEYYSEVGTEEWGED